MTATEGATIPLGWRWQRRRVIYRQGFLPEWRRLLAGRVVHWNFLSSDERDRLESIALMLLAEKRWESSNGFALTDEIQVTIASEAALIALGLPDDCYRKVRNVLVLPTTLMLRGEHSMVPGVVSNSPMPILGQSHHDGTVLLTWDATVHDARHPGTGHNVVFHEFAHQLDLLNGAVDGTPALATQDQVDRWIEVCTRVYRLLQVGAAGPSLSTYGGVNPAEFFAVATEVFFDNPHGLRAEHPDLYDVLAEFYRQDPWSRVVVEDR